MIREKFLSARELERISESDSSRDVNAICGQCNKSHITSAYLAYRYPNEECKKCRHKKVLQELEEKVLSSIQSFNCYAKENNINKEIIYKIKSKLSLIKED